MYVANELVKRYGDYPVEVQTQDTRTWGVQLVIVRDGQMFVQSDEDSANRREAHVLEDSVTFPEMKSRLNASGGGKKAGESPKDCALREMKAELGIEGDGTLVIVDELPIVACGQIREVGSQQKGALLGVVLAAYEPTETEWEALKQRGTMVPIKEMLDQADTDSELSMRPTFRIALQVGRLWNDGGSEKINRLVGGYNHMIIEAMRNECAQDTIELKQGIFGDSL